MRILFIILLTLLTSGCGLFKPVEKHRNKTVRHIAEKGIRIVEIPMDSIVYKPVIRYTQKDTVITVENKNLILKTTQKRGKVTKIKAIQKPKKQTETYEQEVKERIRTTDYKSEGLKFSKTDILILFLLLAGLVAVNNLTKKN